MKVGLRREDPLCRSKWSVGISQIAAGLRRIWPLSVVEGTTRFQTFVSLSLCEHCFFRIRIRIFL